MRHTLAPALVRTVTIALLGAAVLFAAWANSAGGGGRVDEILALEADTENGRAVYTEISNPTCASCHSLDDAGATSNVASDLDELGPSARTTLQSLLSGTIASHDREDFVHDLSNRELADLARYIEEVAGN